jgi:hypothetical protein
LRAVRGDGVDELEQCLNHVKHLKKNILKRLTGKEEEWQRLCVILEFGTIDDSLRDIPFEKRLKNARLIEFIYVQILFALEMIKNRKTEKRRRTMAKKYWEERERMEWKMWKKGKDPKLVGTMALFASIPKDYPFPFYSPSRDHTKKVEVTKRPPGRPEKDLRYFLGETLSEPLRDLSRSRRDFSSFRSDILEKLFQLISG